MTVRLPRATRQRIEALARQEGRSLSAQVERLIERGMDAGELSQWRGRVRDLSGALRGGRVPSLADFRQVRKALTTSLRGRMDVGKPRR